MRFQATNSAKRVPRRAEGGFSLIELLIVVAIILIIAAIAIPNFLRSKILANESANVQNMRSITVAEFAYANLYGIGFSAALVNLGGTAGTSTAANLIDDVLASGSKSGYVLTYAPNNQDASGRFMGFTISGAPLTVGVSGQRYYFADQSGVIRYNMTAPAQASDPSI
jgi:type IV pilus assembly protein PilA